MQPRTTIYLDYAATSPLWPEARAAMAPYLDDRFANASSVYAAAREARKAVEEAREIVAAAVGARPDEVVFTSGGTEADNIALQGVAVRAGSENSINDFYGYHWAFGGHDRSGHAADIHYAGRPLKNLRDIIGGMSDMRKIGQGLFELRAVFRSVHRRPPHRSAGGRLSHTAHR